MPVIAIVDDQKEYLKEISAYVRNFYFEQGLPYRIDTFFKAELLIYELQDGKYYDVYLLDIEMPEINGLELARQIRNYDMEGYLVFITSHMKFLLKAYDYYAYQYIPKNDLKKKLISTLSSLQKRIEIDRENAYLICTNNRYEKILYKDLYYIFKDRKNVVFVTDKEEIYVRDTLKNVFKKLDPREFIWADRGYIVNIVHIMRLKQNTLYLRNGDSISVSRTYTELVKESIHCYWKEHSK